ncbi:MAG: tetratricopeptide repeat protein, partial [Chloroflexi bacterium]|nr:tetratricopeptide repeat protein [Chloroflexota bacterium]
TPEAAETITGASLRTLQTLVNKALVLRTKTGRYDIHELLRQYGYERLEASGTLANILHQHSAYYANFLHEREADLKGRRQLEAMDEFEADMDNLRLAWYQALADQDMERIDQLAFPLTSYAEFRSRQGELVFWLADAEQALRGQYAADHDYGRLLTDYGRTLYWLARTPEAEMILREALAIARASADASGIAYSGLELSRVAFELGNRDEAWALVEESFHLSELSGDEYTLALALFHQGYQLGVARRFDETLATYSRVLQIQRQLGDEVHVSTTLNNLAAARSWHGEDEETGAILLEALALKQRLKLRNRIVTILGNLANWEIRHNRIEAARPYAEAALQIARETANPRDLLMALLHGIELAVVTDQLDEAERLLAEVMQLRVHWERFVENRSYVLANIADILLARGDWQGARAAIIAGLRLKPDPAALAYLGFAIAGAGQTERGLELVALAVNNREFMKVIFTYPVGIHHLEIMKRQLTEEAYAAAWERGKALDFEATVAELLAEYESDTSPI